MIKHIKGYEDRYTVDEDGNVFSILRKRYRKQQHDRDGYLYVGLCKDGVVSNKYVHDLVAEAFIPNPDSLPEVNHKDENKENNNVSNLEWCTSKYNNNYGTAIERRRQKRINGAQSKTVYQYSLSGELIKVWPSTREVERQTGWSQVLIAMACRGVIHTAKGYKWSYVPL